MARADSSTKTHLPLTETQRISLDTLRTGPAQPSAAPEEPEAISPFRDMVDALPHLVWMSEARGQWEFCNQRWYDYTGFGPAQILGHAWMRLLHVDDARAVWAIWTQALSSGAPFEVECRLRGLDGEYRWFVNRGVPQRNREGAVVRWFGAFTDIHERRAFEAALRESEERWRTLADAAPVLIWMSDTEKSCIFVNTAWLDFTGRPMEWELGHGWTEGIHADEVTRSFATYSAAFESRAEFGMEYRLRRRDGEYRWILDRGAPRFAPDGTFLGYIGACIDIHEQKTAAEKLATARDVAEAASRAKDEFLAALSHELRTPLTPVLMTAAALENDPEVQGDFREQISMIRRNVELEARLIDDLLDLTRITRGKLKLQTSSADIHSLLGHTNDIVLSDAQTKRVNLLYELKAGAHFVAGDPTRLHQVFWNLLKNAIKFTPEEGRITIRSYNTEAGSIAVQVEDTGIGIEADHLPHIFEAFDQGAAGGKHRFGGLGLGLTIARAVVELHGGTIRAESAGEGLGATFTVELATADAPATTHPGTPETSTAGAAPLRILLVEDHPHTLAVLARLLTKRGHEVTTAGAVREARTLADNQKFDLVVSDLGLPDGNGIELMRELRAKHRLPGIALSGYGMESDLEKSREAGFAEHLVKPVDFERLHQAVLRVAKVE